MDVIICCGVGVQWPAGWKEVSTCGVSRLLAALHHNSRLESLRVTGYVMLQDDEQKRQLSAALRSILACITGLTELDLSSDNCNNVRPKELPKHSWTRC